ncbi:hypothetical protein GQ53DRAFT_752133 [Thozetella sp. PMI_491]|nr:hypothetical protein GQ53DRAFT_752133 [Thozetella sp. PMI_491]
MAGQGRGKLHMHAHAVPSFLCRPQSRPQAPYSLPANQAGLIHRKRALGGRTSGFAALERRWARPAV